MQNLKQALRTSQDSGLTLQHRVANFLLIYRNTPHTTTPLRKWHALFRTYVHAYRTYICTDVLCVRIVRADTFARIMCLQMMRATACFWNITRTRTHIRMHIGYRAVHAYVCAARNIVHALLHVRAV